MSGQPPAPEALPSSLRTPEQMEWIQQRFTVDGLERLARSSQDYYDQKGYYLPDVAALAHAALAEVDARQKGADGILAMYDSANTRAKQYAAERDAAVLDAATLRKALAHLVGCVLDYRKAPEREYLVRRLDEAILRANPIAFAAAPADEPAGDA